MALKKNVIYIYFKGKHLVTSKSQYQYNHGQFLYFADLDLPQTFEVHFSNTDEGYAKPQIGSNRLVEIPDAYFWTKSSQIYAWIYLHEGTTDGETKYEVIINLERRSEPVYEEILPTQQTTIERAIAELNNAVDVTTENANKTGEDRTQVSNIKDEIVDLKEDIDANAELATEKAQEAVNASLRSEASAQNAAEYESNAHGYSNEAKDYAQQALESKITASQKATIATDASVETLGYRDETLVAKNDVLNLKQDVIGYKNETKGYLDETKGVRADVQNIDNEVKDYASQAQASATNASQSATASANSASASAQSASQSAQIKADVEDLVDDAQGYAQASAQSATASANSASQAQGYAQSASASAQSSSGYASQADISANTASNKASEASTSAQTASNKASEASQSATNASQSAQTAEQAKTASQTAQGLAESARDSAVQAKTDAESAKADAESARDEAQQAVASISGALADKAPIITDAASGAVASFSDGADDIPLKSLVVDINPVQDLHGQSNPYPAGGGKNKLDPTVFQNFPVTRSGVTVTYNNDGTFTANGTATSRVYITLATMDFEADTILSGCPTGGVASTYSLAVDGTPIADRGNGYTITEAVSNGKLMIVIGVGYTCNNLVFKPMIRLASVTDATYAPYENICPISGWTEVDVEQSGVNVWDEEWESGFINNNGENEVNAYYFRTKGYIPIKPNTQYFYKCPTTYSDYGRFRFYDANKAFVSQIGTSTVVNRAFTTPENAYYMRFTTGEKVGIGTTYNHDISINYPSSDHDYHPYTGRSITIQLGQTVYGGKLDVLSGELVIDRAMVDLGTLSWAKGTTTGGTNDRWICNAPNDAAVTPTASNKANFVCENYATLTADDTWFKRSTGIAALNRSIYIYDPNTLDMTSAEFKSAMSGVQLCYELATPIEIQLDAHAINSLYGVNNIWADTGDVEVEHRADTKLYIDKKIAEAIASITQNGTNNVTG